MPLVDSTPRLAGQSRHLEIDHYLSALTTRPDFVVLDDSEEAGIGFGPHFIHVSDGLEDEHVEQALQVLLDDGGEDDAGASTAL